MTRRVSQRVPVLLDCQKFIMCVTEIQNFPFIFNNCRCLPSIMLLWTIELVSKLDTGTHTRYGGTGLILHFVRERTGTIKGASLIANFKGHLSRGNNETEHFYWSMLRGSKAIPKGTKRNVYISIGTFQGKTG